MEIAQGCGKLRGIDAFGAHDRGFQGDRAAVAGGVEPGKEVGEVDVSLAGMQNGAQPGEVPGRTVVQIADMEVCQASPQQPGQGEETFRLVVEGGKAGVKDKPLFWESGVDRGEICRGIGGGAGNIFDEQFKAMLLCGLPQSREITEVDQKSAVGIGPAPEVENDLRGTDPFAHDAVFLPQFQRLPAEVCFSPDSPGAEKGAHLLVSVDHRETEACGSKLFCHVGQFVQIGGEHHQLDAVQGDLLAEGWHYPKNMAVVVLVHTTDDGTGGAVQGKMCHDITQLSFPVRGDGFFFHFIIYPEKLQEKFPFFSSISATNVV